MVRRTLPGLPRLLWASVTGVWHHLRCAANYAAASASLHGALLSIACRLAVSQLPPAVAHVALAPILSTLSLRWFVVVPPFKKYIFNLAPPDTYR